MKQTSDNKPISVLWFYLFALFFGGLGISTFVMLLFKKPGDQFMALWGFGMFLVGLLFLLEPLDRKNLLPPGLAHFYLRLQKSFQPAKDSAPRGVKISLTVSFLAILGILAGLISSDNLLGSTWSAARIYVVGMFSLYALFQLFTLTALLIAEHYIRYTGTSHVIRFFTKTNIVRFTENKSSRSVGTGLLISFVSIAGFFVSIWIPYGNIIGPSGLIFMVAVSFGQMLLFGSEAEARIAAETELKTAHDIQMNLMPIEDPSIPGFDIHGICFPANEVGGDYFDYVWLDDAKTRFGIAIADVSGKAMKAAMTAVMTSGMVYREIGSDNSPKTILGKINKPMFLKTSQQMFTALSFAAIDTQTKRLTFSNAGQMPPVLKRGGDVRFLKVPGIRLPLGVLEEIVYSELIEQLERGDLLFFYTDGIPEAMNETKEMFGFDRLVEFFKNIQSNISAKEINDVLLAAVKSFTGSAEQHDDMTVVVVKIV